MSIRSFVKEIDRKYENLLIKRPLTSEQKEEIQTFYKQLVGKKVPLSWHRFLYSRTGVFSPRYIPLSLYRIELIGKANQYGMMDAYADKNISDLLFPNVKQPKIYLKNINGYYYIDGQSVTKEKALDSCKNLTNCIIKPSRSTRGQGVKVLSVHEGTTNIAEKTLEQVFEDYDKDFLIQEMVKQHPAMAALNPTSLNTIRLLTYRSGEEILLLYAVIRIGRKNQVIDNESAGGISARIEPDGKLAKYAYGAPGQDQLEKSDAGIVLEGYQIPEFQKVIDTVKQLHFRLPYFNIAAWDMAITEDGEPIFIEWNANPDLSQTAYGPAFGQYTERIFKETFNKINTRNIYW
ncbi:MAG: hypothetical protein MJZ76_01410 [Bacteroidales bacterium]|nr:hypothetical protein [Bacteroidales bacterium]